METTSKLSDQHCRKGKQGRANRTTTEDFNIPLVEEFALALSTFDLKRVSELLADDGEFQTSSHTDSAFPEIVLHQANKVEFMSYLTRRVAKFREQHPERERLEYFRDQCLQCNLGAPVLLFEDGHFPVLTVYIPEHDKVGMRIEVHEGLINEIVFCYRFLHTENEVFGKTPRFKQLMKKYRHDHPDFGFNISDLGI